MGFKKSFFKNVLISGSYNYLSQLLPFLFSPITFRLLPPEAHGTVALITVFTGFFSVFSDGGISFALIRSDYGSRYEKALNNLAWLIGLALCLLTILLAYPISLYYNDQALLWPTVVLSFSFLIRSFSLTQGAILTRRMEFNYIGKVSFICSTVSVLTTIALAYLGFFYWSIIIPQLLVAVLTVILFERKTNLGFELRPMREVRAAFRLTKKLMGNILGFNIINYWARNADNLIVGKFYGKEQLGIYSKAYMLLTTPLGLIMGPFNSVLFPSLKELKKQNGNIESEYLFICKAIALISFPVMAIFVLLPNQLIHILWGNSWSSVASLLPYFGIALFTQAVLNTSGMVLVSEKKERLYFYSGLINSSIFIACIIVGSLFSVVGIAQLYSLGFIALILPFSVWFVFLYGLKFNRKKTLIFWIPKIILSIGLWVGVYVNSMEVEVICLVLLTLHLIMNARKGFGQAYKKVSDYMAKRKPVASQQHNND